MRRLQPVSLLALILGAILIAAPLHARDFTTKRSSVSKSGRHRSGPTLPSEVEERRYTPPVREPSAAEQAREEYYRERADYYKGKREKRAAEDRQEQRLRSGSSGGACMYGADGSVIWAPPGRDC